MVVGQSHSRSYVLGTACGTDIGRKDNVDSSGLKIFGYRFRSFEVAMGACEIIQHRLFVDIYRYHAVTVEIKVLCHYFGGFRLSVFEYAVLSGISEIRDYESDGFRSEPSDGILKQKHLDNVAVGVRVLYYHNIVFERFFVDSRVIFSIRKFGGSCLNVLRSENVGQISGQIPGRGTAYDYHNLC